MANETLKVCEEVLPPEFLRVRLSTAMGVAKESGPFSGGESQCLAQVPDTVDGQANAKCELVGWLRASARR